jgi:hypothetical protein
MNSKRLSQRLDKMNYNLTTDIFGWVVVSRNTGFEWRFSTLGGVMRFVVDEEALVKMNNLA